MTLCRLRRMKCNAAKLLTGPVYTNVEIFEFRYIFTWIRVDGALNHSGERFQKDVVSVSFTGFLRTEGQFV